MSYEPNVVSRSDVQAQQYVVLGKILDVTSVTIEGDRELGAAAGAVVGADLGSDNNKAPAATGIIGALIGSAVGAEIGANVSQKKGVELLIETERGKLVSIIQEVSKYDFKKDQKVRIIKRNGKSRVIPFD
tara:strand:- start:12896 stop:13288 length:393 start_codon:yes stop_codon:yes gene_type:complete